MARTDGLRWGALVALGLVGIPLYLRVLAVGDLSIATFGGLGLVLVGVTALSVAGVALVCLGPSARTNRGQWIELGIIIGVGVIWRALLWPSPPLFSNDAYRYAWDAHLLLQGVSPYAHTPLDPALIPLRDTQIWPHVGFRDAPTIYPPGAELLFVLAGLVAPLKLAGIKVAIALCDGAVAVLTMLLLRQRRLDPRWVIVYWWSPLPILEFALNAHVDAEAIAWTLAAVLVAEQRWRGARGVAGVLLGLAALTKIYPLLFVIALARRGDRALYVGLVGTIIAAYLPIIPLGLGGGGFLATYFHQRWVDQGIVQYWLGLTLVHVFGNAALLTLLQLGGIASFCLLLAYGRWRFGWRMEATILLLSAVWMLFAPHLFPWYIAAILPFLAFYLGPGLNFPALGFWIFALLMPFTYIIFAPDGNANLFQGFFYLAGGVALWPWLRARGRAIFVQQGVSSWNQ